MLSISRVQGKQHIVSYSIHKAYIPIISKLQSPFLVYCVTSRRYEFPFCMTIFWHCVTTKLPCVVFHHPTQTWECDTTTKIYHILFSLTHGTWTKQNQTKKKTFPHVATFKQECTRWSLSGTQTNCEMVIQTTQEVLFCFTAAWMVDFSSSFLARASLTKVLCHHRRWYFLSWEI